MTNPDVLVVQPKDIDKFLKLIMTNPNVPQVGETLNLHIGNKVISSKIVDIRRVDTIKASLAGGTDDVYEVTLADGTIRRMIF